MAASSFFAYWKARKLSDAINEDYKLAAVYASSDIDVYPYQIAAARFALRSPYLGGVMLCDEGGLGKTFEALLIVVQKWHEGENSILLVVPTHLIGQWHEVLEQRFSVPSFFIDTEEVWQQHLAGDANPFYQDGIVVTTYDFAYEKSDALSEVPWSTAVFDEADALCHVYTGEHKMSAALKAATKDAYKILLTPTPIMTSIMDVYGLINFIDETALPDPDSFYKCYFRKPERYPELAGQVSKYCFRTLRSQVGGYVKIPHRIPVTAQFLLNEDEQQLSDLLNKYLSRPKKAAFPKMDAYELTLMLTRTLSSSTFALAKTLEGIEKRLVEIPDAQEELSEIRAMLALATSITENAKGEELLTALKMGFSELKKLGANRKAVIFTESRETQRHLVRVLNENGYDGEVLTFHGGKSRDFDTLLRFRNGATILVTTDLAAKGLNFEFCSFIVNYDLPYNTLTLDQRINRCHRQGQQSDVIVLNFLNPSNFADVRTLELINKRVLQFSGVFGMSDDVVGGFGVDIERDFRDTLRTARPKSEIEAEFQVVLSQNEPENTEIVTRAEDVLFTTFSRDVADKVTITPQYIEKETRRINAGLWDVVSCYFEDYNRRQEALLFQIDHCAQTIEYIGSGEPPELFYYWTGSRNRPYRALKSYGMRQDFKPRTGKITLSSVIGRGILHNIECADTGTVTVDEEISRCTIGLYCVRVKSSSRSVARAREYTVLVGKTDCGEVLSDEQCHEILALPIASCVEDEHRTAHWLKSTGRYGNRHELDGLVDTGAFIRRFKDEADSTGQGEAAILKARAANHKAELDKRLDALRMQITAAEKELETDLPRLERIAAQKKLNTLQKELKQGEQSLFFDGLRIEQELEERLAVLSDKTGYTAEIMREFLIEVEGK